MTWWVTWLAAKLVFLFPGQFIKLSVHILLLTLYNLWAFLSAEKGPACVFHSAFVKIVDLECRNLHLHFVGSILFQVCLFIGNIQEEDSS